MQPTVASLGLDKLTVEDRVRLMHELYESIPNKADCFELSEEDKLELDQEIADCRLHPEQGKSWEETKRELNALRARR
jgi:putative addiction module component (TIGR02574 family)